MNNQPLDKNGNVIEPGMKVRLCQTHADYLSTAAFFVRYYPTPSLWSGPKFVDYLSTYRNADTNYHSVEIV